MKMNIPKSTSAERGFSLLELVVATSLSVVVMGAVIGTMMAGNRSFRAISNYGEIHADGRKAVDRFSKDFRKANNVTNLATTSVTLSVPTGFNTQGSITGTQSVRYYQTGTDFVRHNLTTGEVATLASNVTTASFNMYNRVGNRTTLTSFSKGVQLEIKLRKIVAATQQTEDYLSARLVMRNKP
jgi:prepilin-type N-terminal cleavage/methylation domain-containing protein